MIAIIVAANFDILQCFLMLVIHFLSFTNNPCTTMFVKTYPLSQIFCDVTIRTYVLINKYPTDFLNVSETSHTV